MLGFITNSLLELLPTWIYPAAVLAGAVFYFATGIVAKLPAIGVYAQLLRPVGFLVFSLGLFFWGGAGVIEMQKTAVAAAEAKVKAVEAEQQKITEELNSRLQAQAAKTRQQTAEIKREVEIRTVEINRDCTEINSTARELYNRSIRNEQKK